MSTTTIEMPCAVAIHTTDLAAPRRPERGGLWSTLANVCHLLQLDIKVHDETLEALFQHRRLKPGEQAYSTGQAFETLYVVNAGFLKTVILDSDGNERVVSFPMKGDLLGSDGICDDRHVSEVVALSDCDLIVIPFKQLLSLGHACQELEHIMYRAVSRHMVQESINLATLGSLRAEARVARFLAMEADRYAALKYSSQSFRLRMTRREIGSYLGLTLETVSRSLSALDAARIICVNQRDIEILKPDTLRALPPIDSTVKNRSRDIEIPKVATPVQTMARSMLPKTHPGHATVYATA
jgi:CRP/FNR family transcriptional regulator, anaerobic regulatory protein